MVRAGGFTAAAASGLSGSDMATCVTRRNERQPIAIAFAPSSNGGGCPIHAGTMGDMDINTASRHNELF